jgi:hypothetical protein
MLELDLMLKNVKKNFFVLVSADLAISLDFKKTILDGPTVLCS